MGDTEASQTGVKISRGEWNENAVSFHLDDTPAAQVDLRAVRRGWLQRYGSWIEACELLNPTAIAVRINPAAFHQFLASGGWEHPPDDPIGGLRAEIFDLLPTIRGDENGLE